MTPNDQLMEQCRREAEAKYPAPPYVQLPDGLDEIFGPDVRHIKQWAYAEALFHERSKPRLTVEDVLELIPKCTERGQLNETYLRNAMNAKLNQTNG